VKTLKRDCLHVTIVVDAKTALEQIAGWFDDYNENHPHSGLSNALASRVQTRPSITYKIFRTFAGRGGFFQDV
jgi:hypothetical protein